MEHKGLHRLIAAAVVNQNFCCQLLENPLKAIGTGYLDQSFPLTEEEHELLASIKVSDLPSFSQQIHQWISKNGHNGRRNGQLRHDEEPQHQLHDRESHPHPSPVPLER